ncbi:MAG: hypothetical protein NVSMB27_29310 [Ktedonobacteraceae bacterium]
MAAPLNKVVPAGLVTMDSLSVRTELWVESRVDQQDAPETSFLVADQPQVMPFPGKVQEYMHPRALSYPAVENQRQIRISLL